MLRNGDDGRDEGVLNRQRLTDSQLPSTPSVLSEENSEDRDDTDNSDNSALDSESDEQDNPIQKALILPEILENVLRFLETRDRLSCRLVNSTWCGIVTNTIRKNGPIIHFGSTSEMFLSDPSNSNSSSFLKTMEESQDNPCTKFSIEVKSKLNEYQALIDTIGSEITYLEINSKWNLRGNREFSSWMSSMKNLHTLKLDFSRIFEAKQLFGKNDEVKLEAMKTIEIKNIHGSIEANSGFLDDLFSRARNLLRLKLDLSGFKRERPSPLIFARPGKKSKNAERILKSFNNHGRLSVMKDMSFTGLTNSLIDILLQMSTNGLKLKSFNSKINFMNCSHESYKFRMFLESQKDYLEKVVLYLQPNYFLEFPDKMPALKSLEFHMEVKGISFFSFRSFFKAPVDFFKQFSSLTELKLQGFWSQQLMEELFGQIDELTLPPSCTTLKTLRLPYGSYLSEKGWISKISKIFPNVCSLDLRHPRNHTLHEVWASWPGLTTLKIVAFHSENNFCRREAEDPDEKCLDAGFTGTLPIMKQFCTLINSCTFFCKSTNRNWMAQSNAILKYFKRDPSITCLKGLRNFELKLISFTDTDRSPAGGIVTELLIYLALIKMPHLKNLRICEWLPVAKPNHCVIGSTCDLTVDCVEDLKQNLEDTRISVLSIQGRDFKIPNICLCYRYNYHLTDVHEEEVCTVNARRVMSGKSVRNRGYASHCCCSRM